MIVIQHCTNLNSGAVAARKTQKRKPPIRKSYQKTEKVANFLKALIQPKMPIQKYRKDLPNLPDSIPADIFRSISEHVVKDREEIKRRKAETAFWKDGLLQTVRILKEKLNIKNNEFYEEKKNKIYELLQRWEQKLKIIDDYNSLKRNSWKQETSYPYR